MVGGIQERFIQETLESEGARMIRNQTPAIEAAYQRRSGRLLSDRKVTVSGSDFHFSHPAYERFLDLKAKGQRDRRIHNRFVFGTYSAVGRRLLYGFTDEVAHVLRDTTKTEFQI